MAARAIWKGIITIDDFEVPVKLYSGIEDRSVHFRLLHDRDLAPVKQEMVHSGNGREVARDAIVMAAPVSKTRFIGLSQDDLAAVEPPESRAITVDRFVKPEAIDHALYDRPYWLGPDTGGGKGYWQLCEALRHQGREGIAHWVMRKRSYVGSLRVEGEHLMLVTLRRAGELVEPTEIDPPGGRTPDPQELSMARQLVGMLKGSFDPTEYHDQYRERVLELIARKAKGEKITLHKVEKPKPEAANLSRALAASLAAIKPAKRGHAKEHAHG